jgi:hypothetical protein
VCERVKMAHNKGVLAFEGDADGEWGVVVVEEEEFGNKECGIESKVRD